MQLESVYLFLNQPKYVPQASLSSLSSFVFNYIKWDHLFLCFLSYFILSAIYNLYWSPLKSIPGPWYAAISELWLTSHVIRLRRVRAIDSLFRKYGPIVRVAPNKVYFLDVQTMKYVYGASAKLSKSALYKGFLIHESDQAMSILDHGPHAMHRKGFAPHYTPANLAKFQPEMHEFTLQLVNNLHNLGGFVAYDTIEFISHLMIDISCVQLFGYRVDSISKWATTLSKDSASAHSDPFSAAIHDFPKRALLKGAFPKWLWFLVSKIPIPQWRQICDSDSIVGDFVTERVQEEVTRMNNDVDLENTERMTMISRLLRYHIKPLNKMMETKDVISEATGHMIAAVDTTAITSSYIFWELSRRRDIVLKLREELDSVMADPRILPDIQKLNELPYLNALIKEGLRQYSSSPSPLERVVPESSSSSPFTMLGYGLPPGTVIGSQAWSSHQIASIFQEPDRFEPSRWLESSEGLSRNTTDAKQNGSLTQFASEVEKGSEIFSDTSQASLMQAHMFPFGHGPRVCVGQNLAMMMFRIIIAAFVRNFDIVAPQETNETSMYIMESFITFPAGTQCKMKFIPRKK